MLESEVIGICKMVSELGCLVPGQLVFLLRRAALLLQGACSASGAGESRSSERHTVSLGSHGSSGLGGSGLAWALR